LKNNGSISRYLKLKNLYPVNFKNYNFSKCLQIKHKRNYNAEQDKVRFEIFKETVAFVEQQNAKYARGEIEWMSEINFFADLTKEERNMYMMPNAPKRSFDVSE
jgi:Cathepsin propeptide inhibitor domain (I29)